MPGNAEVPSLTEGDLRATARFRGDQRTRYFSSVITLFALYGVGFDCERTYHRPDDVNLNVVDASPALLMTTSRLVTNRYAPELNR